MSKDACGTGAGSHYAAVQGDVIEVLRRLPDNCADGLFCDPPYGLSFMGKKWDYDVPSVDVWRECLRVLKPGAPLLAFGGSRTFHRIACGIEDAGFEVYDCLMWLHAKGMAKPCTLLRKYLGREDAWAEYGAALAPAFEPITVACKPWEGTIAENTDKWGCGPLNVADSRIGHDMMGSSSSTGLVVSENVSMSGANYGRIAGPLVEGRWPKNVLLDETAGQMLDAQTGIRPSTLTGRADPNTTHANPGDNHGTSTFGGGNSRVYADTGGASRFYYCTKVSKREREAGCESLPMRTAAECTDREEGSAGSDRPQAGAGRSTGARNFHPTLKPLALTRYLANLIRPPTANAVLLVPYCGTGSEMIGAMQVGWPHIIGIEQSSEYLEILRARVAHWTPDAQTP